MATVLIKVRTAYPRSFLDSFESQSDARQQAGEYGCVNYRVADDPNLSVVMSVWEGLEDARRFWMSGEGKKHVAAWKAVEADILFLEEIKS